MFSFLISGLFFLFLFRVPVSAQIPLYYQLLEAYHPDNSLSFTSKVISSSITPTPSPIPTLSPSTESSSDLITIAVIGDSMIDTLGESIPQLAASLKPYFPNRQFKILNYGVGSSDIEYGIYRLTHNYQYQGKDVPSLVSQHPDIVIVESFAYNNYGNSESSINRHWLDLGSFTDTLKKELPQTKIVLAATIAPNSISFANGIKDLHLTSMERIEKADTIKLYLQNLVNFANSQGFSLADAYHPSLFHNEGLVDYISSTDHLHPSALGSQFFCDTIADTLFRNKLIE